MCVNAVVSEFARFKATCCLYPSNWAFLDRIGEAVAQVKVLSPKLGDAFFTFMSNVCGIRQMRF